MGHTQGGWEEQKSHKDDGRDRNSHMAQRALCACVGQGAADVVLLGPPWDRFQARFLLSACLLVLVASYRRRAPVLDFATLFSLVLLLTGTSVPFVPWYLSVPFVPRLFVCLTRNLWTYRFVSPIRNL